MLRQKTAKRNSLTTVKTQGKAVMDITYTPTKCVV